MYKDTLEAPSAEGNYKRITEQLKEFESINTSYFGEAPLTSFLNFDAINAVVKNIDKEFVDKINLLLTDRGQVVYRKVYANLTIAINAFEDNNMERIKEYKNVILTTAPETLEERRTMGLVGRINNLFPPELKSLIYTAIISYDNQFMDGVINMLPTAKDLYAELETLEQAEINKAISIFEQLIVELSGKVKGVKKLENFIMNYGLIKGFSHPNYLNPYGTKASQTAAKPVFDYKDERIEFLKFITGKYPSYGLRYYPKSLKEGRREYKKEDLINGVKVLRLDEEREGREKYLGKSLNAWFNFYKDSVKASLYSPEVRNNIIRNMELKSPELINREILEWRNKLNKLLTDTTLNNRLKGIRDFIEFVFGLKGIPNSQYRVNADVVFYAGIPLTHLYDEYVEEFRKIKKPKRKQTKPDEVIEIRLGTKKQPEQLVKNTGFKNEAKNISIIKKITPEANISDVLEKINYEVPKNDLKFLKNNKRHMMHHVGVPGTYQMDIFFSGGIGYLIMINENSRKVYAVMTNRELFTRSPDETGSSENPATYRLSKEAKTVKLLKSALIKLLSQAEVKHIVMDGEAAFYSHEMQNFLKDAGITIRKIYKDNHTSLALIDRVIRTIRDMHYNRNKGKFKIINEQDMEEILQIYNNAIHLGLSKIIGFDVSPEDVANDKDLETEYIKRVEQMNFNVQSQHDFKLSDGEIVYIYNDKNPLTKRRATLNPEPYEVIGRENGLVILKDSIGNVIKRPRFKISYTPEIKAKNKLD